MKFHPDSNGEPLVEVNHCHGKGRGHPCDDKPRFTVQTYRRQDRGGAHEFHKVVDTQTKQTVRTGFQSHQHADAKAYAEELNQQHAPTEPTLKLGKTMKTVAMHSPKERIDAFYKELNTLGFTNPINTREFIVNSEAGIELSPTADGIRLHAIRSFAPKSGAGTRTMNALVALADTHGLSIEGGAKAFKTGKTGTMTSTQLKAWYKKFGFAVKSNGEMRRKPR